MSGQDIVPTPSILVVLHFGGMFPQLRLQLITGTGTPTAAQVISKRSPIDNCTIGGIGLDITGTAGN